MAQPSPLVYLRFKWLSPSPIVIPPHQLRRRFTAARLLEYLGRPQKAERLFQEVIAADLEHRLLKDFFLDLAYLFGFFLRAERLPQAIAVCQRAREELSVIDGEEERGEPARAQIRLVWHRLEEGVKAGTVELGATAVLRTYIKTHWQRPASEPPLFQK